LNARKSPQTAGYSSETEKRQFVSECVVVDAARIEPVSHGKFPANREIYREFCRIWPFAAIFVFIRHANSNGYSQIP